MTDPQQPAGPTVPSYPTGQAASPPPAYGTPASSYPAPPAYSAPAGAYIAPAAGYAPGYSYPGGPAPAPVKGPALLGYIALALSLVAAVVAPLIAAFTAGDIGRVLLDVSNLSSNPADDPFVLLSPVRDSVLWLEVSFWVGTIAGIWGLVQGIVAAVKRRGRTPGIIAIIAAVLGAVIYTVAVSFAFIAGAAAASASLL